jgi:DNA-binding CsgD family transcriptional regulator/tetratricopeptide (TPR) repeat protein
MDDPVLLAHVLNRMGNWYANHEQPELAHQHHAEALAIFERLDDRQGIAATLDLLGMAAALGGDLVAAVAALARAATLIRELGDAQGLMGCLANAGTNAIYEHDTLVGAESLAEAVRGGEKALTLAREIDWLAGTAFALALHGECIAAAGNVGRGLELLREGLATAEEIEHRQWMAQAHVGLGGVHVDLLALPAARLHFEQVVKLGEALRSRLWSTIAVGRLASVLVAQGELDAAEEALAEFGPDTPMRTPGQRLLWCARAELALARDDPVAGLAMLDGLYAAAANLTGEEDIPRLARLKAQALAALGRAEEALALLHAAQSVAADQGARSEHWRLHAALAALLREQGREEEASREETAARQLVAALAMTVPDEAQREQFLRAATARLPTPTTMSARRAAKAAFGGLTGREREVATLIACGQTNRAIAETLSVSERTVDAHVGNILRKLGFASRSQIAAWAVERGLPHLDT